MTTLSDPEGRETVKDIIYDCAERVYPVGRLDYLSEGLLIMTNDGDLANKIMHPRYEVTKVYEVKVFGHVHEGILSKIKRGVMTEDGLLKPKSVRVIEQLPNKTWLEFRLNEGKNREIRKICEAVDLVVDKLRRVAIEGLNIQSLGVGKYVYTERKELMKALGLNNDGTKKSVRSFISAKKSLNVGKISKIVGKTAKPADDKRFQNFKKESYYETVRSIKEVKEREVIEAKRVEEHMFLQEKAARFAKVMKKQSKPSSKSYGRKS
jgi:23S rRNA pseudouridine2605 synthase